MTAPDEHAPGASPERDIAELDLASGLLRVGSQSADVHGLTNADLLRRYVALVRVERKLAPGATIVLRDTDIAALAGVLDVEDSDLERDLIAIVGLDRATAADVRRRLSRRRLAAPMAGLALGSLGFFGLRQLTNSSDSNAGAARSAIVADRGAETVSDASAAGPSSVVSSSSSTAVSSTVVTTPVAEPNTSPSTIVVSIPFTVIETPAETPPAAANAGAPSATATASTPSPSASTPRATTTVPAPAADTAMPVFGDQPSISVPPIDGGVTVDPDSDDPFDPIAGAVVIVAPVTGDPITITPGSSTTTTTTSTTIAPIVGDGGISLTP
jgi:hypothetical protein